VTTYADSPRSRTLRSEVAGQVAALLNESLAIQVSSPHADLIVTGALDSMALVQLTHEIEERFGLKLPPMSELDVDAFRSVATMTELILDRRLESEGGVEKPATVPDASRLLVAGEIHALLLAEFSVRVDSPDEDLFRGGALDSMTLVQFILALENHFGISIPLDDLDLDAVTSVSRAADLVASRTIAGEATASETFAASR
jgi:acyl carrier protein